MEDPHRYDGIITLTGYALMIPSEVSVHTTMIQGWIQRMQAGDAQAKDELIQSISGRLERLARKMLRDYPIVSQFNQTVDVFQSAVIRLLRALQDIRAQPESTRAFFSLAATQIRRELLDLARHYRRSKRKAVLQARPLQGTSSMSMVPEPVSPCESENDLETWEAFHEAVGKLDEHEREVVGLIFYHGWTQDQVADLLQVSDRQVRRYWRSAAIHLNELVQGRLPT